MTEQKFKRLIMPKDDSNALSGDMADWCKEHYILTFLLISGAVGVIGNIFTR